MYLKISNLVIFKHFFTAQIVRIIKVKTRLTYAFIILTLMLF
jgi:hypothetical protein